MRAKIRKCLELPEMAGKMIFFCAEYLSLMSMGGRLDGLAYADPAARTKIGVREIFTFSLNLPLMCWYQRFPPPLK